MKWASVCNLFLMTKKSLELNPFCYNGHNAITFPLDKWSATIILPSGKGSRKQAQEQKKDQQTAFPQCPWRDDKWGREAASVDRSALNSPRFSYGWPHLP